QASTTKSLMSLLVGIALDKGYLNSVNQTLYEFFEEVWDPTYDNRKKNITIEQLLTHTSGLANHANNAYPSGSTVYTDCVEWALDDVPLVFDPGEDGSFEYSNDACNLLAAIINNVTSINASMFAKQYLFEPMGIVDEDWDFTQDSKGVNLGGWGFDCTPRIQAKIGMICLNNGTWNGTQLISSNWLREATSYKRDHWWLNQFPIKLYDYGYLFYISEEDGWYYSYGYGGQNIFVIPEYNITVGFTGWGLDSDLNNVDKYYKHMINTYILQFTTGGDTAELIPGFSFLVIILIATIGTGVYIRIIKKKINYS
ncbi:MAG: serine hydrolase domain-containing protein, partial [Promethearchaeota archaeon]